MTNSLTYRRALVTGASSGLGEAICRLLVQEGCQVWGTSRDPARIKVPGVSALKLDLADGEELQSFTRSQIPSIRPDLLINNAGCGIFGNLEQQSPQDIRTQLDLMLCAPATLCSAALEDMKAQRHGCIVNVSSLATLFPLPGMALYNSAKAGLSALSNTLMEEVRREGIVILDFQPGDFRSGFFAATRRTGGSERAWKAAEAHLVHAPDANAIARKLLKGIRKGRSGTIRAGLPLQTTAGPIAKRLLPDSLFQAILRTYLD